MIDGQPGSRLFRAVMVVCGVAAIAGAVTAAIGYALPVYNVPDATAEAAFTGWCFRSGVPDTAGDRYLAMFTLHYPIVDTGISLLLAAATVGLLCWGLWWTVPRESSMGWLRTPAHRWTYVAIGLGIIAWSITGAIESLQIDMNRRLFSWCADSLAIPVFEIIASAVVITPVLLVAGILITLWFGRLPVPLLYWDRARPIRCWLATMVCGLIGLSILALLVLSVPTSGNLTIVPGLIALYLIAATRAALVAPRRRGTDAPIAQGPERILKVLVE